MSKKTAKKTTPELDPPVQRFADDYIKDGKKQANALKQWPDLTPESAAVKANRLLKNDNVRAYIKSHAKMAADNMVELANNAESESVRLNANKDILDRAGYKPEDETQRQALPENIDANKHLLAITEAIKNGDTVELQRIVFNSS